MKIYTKLLFFFNETLNSKTFQNSSHHKLNQYLKYLNNYSNLHKSTSDNIVKSISDCLSDRSTPEEIFNNQYPYYNWTLVVSSFSQQVKYIPNTKFKQHICKTISRRANRQNHSSSRIHNNRTWTESRIKQLRISPQYTIL